MPTLHAESDQLLTTDSARLPPVSENSQALEVRQYSGGFINAGGELTAILKDVTFSVRPSALTAVVGETGSGKTLTALSILGLTPSSFRRTKGEILFEGRDLARLNESQLREIRGSGIAMVFQDARAALNPVFTIGKQLQDVYRCHLGMGRKEARSHSEEALERVRIPHPATCMKQYPHELSGGMAQRAQLALALSCNPKLLVLDEPTTGLDVTIQADILELIVELARETGMTTVLITHDLGIVAETCDHVVVMEDGEVREKGTCKQIMTAPVSEYTQMLIAASRLDELTVEE